MTIVIKVTFSGELRFDIEDVFVSLLCFIFLMSPTDGTKIYVQNQNSKISENILVISKRISFFEREVEGGYILTVKQD